MALFLCSGDGDLVCTTRARAVWRGRLGPRLLPMLLAAALASLPCSGDGDLFCNTRARAVWRGVRGLRINRRTALAPKAPERFFCPTLSFCGVSCT